MLKVKTERKKKERKIENCKAPLYKSLCLSLIYMFGDMVGVLISPAYRFQMYWFLCQTNDNYFLSAPLRQFFPPKESSKLVYHL